MELSFMDMLLIILILLFLGIGISVRRLRSRMDADMKKNVLPYMSTRHMFRHGHHEKKSGKK